jgi:hypothetical protein
MHRHMRRRPGSAIAAVLALALAGGSLGGCAAGAIGGLTPLGDALMSEMRDLKVDPADSCGTERAQFAEARTFFTARIVEGALIGGAVGAAGGAAIGALTGGAGTGALIGLGAGSLAGGLFGYYSTMSERHKDQETLARAINSDLTREGQQIDRTTATFARLRECRFARANALKAQLRAGRIARPEAEAGLKYQAARFQEEMSLARHYGVTMQKRLDEFRDAAETMQRKDPALAAAPARRGRGGTPGQQVVAQATESVPEKRSTFLAAVNTAEQRSKVAFVLDGATPAS